MAKTAKHTFHCEKCGNPCAIYKKGKKHRVLVCPSCGVLATNPFSFGKSLRGAGKGALASIPIVGGALAGATEGFEEGKVPAGPAMERRSSNRFSTDERVRLALASR